MFGISQLLQQVANSKIAIDNTRALLKKEDLTEFELIMENQFNDYVLRSDLAASIGAFIALDHVPGRLMSKLGE